MIFDQHLPRERRPSSLFPWPEFFATALVLASAVIIDHYGPEKISGDQVVSSFKDVRHV